jgi:hypothetical protein
VVVPGTSKNAIKKIEQKKRGKGGKRGGGGAAILIFYMEELLRVFELPLLRNAQKRNKKPREKARK